MGRTSVVAFGIGLIVFGMLTSKTNKYTHGERTIVAPNMNLVFLLPTHIDCVCSTEFLYHLFDRVGHGVHWMLGTKLLCLHLLLLENGMCGGGGGGVGNLSILHIHTYTHVD